MTARFVTWLALTTSLPISESVRPTEFDVWVPTVLYPDDATIWYAGEYNNVVWDASNPPASITNPTGKIYLADNNIIYFEYLLASDFSLLDGQVEVQVPYGVTDGSYNVVLIGDSGNVSPSFTIIGV